MRKQLTYIAPLKAGIVLAILYAILSLIVVPFFILAALMGKASGNPGPNPAIFGVAFAIGLPFLYAAGGFLGGLIGAALYNLVAKWTGGFEFETRDVA